MKKISIALMTLAAALAAVSCQKMAEFLEPAPSQMTITAVSEQIATPGLTKAEMAYKYDVLWQENDSICVKDASKSAIFKLTAGAGTTRGTFTGSTVTGDVKAYYPASLVNGEKLVWPTTQENNQVAPMFCRKNIATDTEDLNFKSLGAVMQIVLTTTAEDITLKYISIKDGEKTMSGEFDVQNDSLAVISATDKAGITLDLGEGETIGVAAKYFNIAVPAGKYDDLTLTFTATDGRKCKMTSKTMPEIKRNVVGRITLCAPEFIDTTPEGALKGEFSISAGKKVKFSKGNLYWDGDSYEFEENQYTIGTWNAENHVNYFFWSNSHSVAKAESYSDASAADSDVFFTNATAETAKADFTVSGVTGKFRTLSAEEWTYILSTRENAADLLVEDVTVCDVEHCLVIAPDACWNGYVFDKTKKSYDAAEWTTAEAAGLVCLPPAGYRDGTDVKSGEGNGFYWASTTDAADKASNLGFKKSDN